MLTDTDGSGHHGRRHRRMGSTDAAIPLPMALASGSSHRSGGGSNTGSRRDDDLERHVHVNTSDFDLLEQTEEDNDGAGNGRRIDAIGIRAFKMLSLLRGEAGGGGGDTHRNMMMGGTTTDGDDGGGTTFDEMMQGCSVGVRAKGFYNLLSLINHQFVRVRQTKAYDTIYITSDIYF